MVGNGLGCITVEPLLLSNKDTSLIRTLPTVYSFMEIVTKLYAVGGYYVIPRGPGQRGSVCVCVCVVDNPSCKAARSVMFWALYPLLV